MCARLALKLLSDRALQQAHRDLWLLPLWDIVSFAIFVASFWSSRVIWRGFSFEVDGDGLLSAAQDERVTRLDEAQAILAQRLSARQCTLNGTGMMKHLGRVAALAGLIASLWLVWQDNPGAVLGALRAAGAGLLLAALAHVLPMLANACDWRSLIRGANRPVLAEDAAPRVGARIGE